ncbi:MAG: carbohydrate ABC transporter substrate-binding protein [Burkholderiales bacterium]|nr:carbohydrate ABC transporter substrate-binding protein [Anaerolineae bacterium]
MVAQKMSRRQALKLLGGAAAGASVASAFPAFASNRSSVLMRLQSYEGRVVIFSTFDPMRYAPVVEAVEAAFPGVTVDWRFLPSERFVELFSAAEIAGDQIDIMDLNGQDLRRYALAGKMLDLSDTPYLDRFRPVGLQTYTIADKLWALPRGGISGFTFLSNMKLLNDIGAPEPETYDDLLALKPELEAVGASVFTHSGQNIYLWPVWQFWAFAQTSGNQPVEKTIATLQGDMKFTDPEHVAALDILRRFTEDGLFVNDVLSLDTDGAQVQFHQGSAAFWYHHTSAMVNYRAAEAELTNMEMSLQPPVQIVEGAVRQMPGGTGNATGIFANIAPERLETAQAILDLMTSDEWVAFANTDNGDPVSCNVNVQASDDPIAIKYAETCADNQFVYLDWMWPPEITRSFQEEQQAIVAGTQTPEGAATNIQSVMDQLYMDGYTFE